MKLAIVVSHPIQYYSPWYRYLAESTQLTLKVFFLWDFGVTNQMDPDFCKFVSWDVPLLDGYDYEFVPNVSKKPGTNHFLGLDNPSLVTRLNKWGADVILIFGYHAKSLLEVIFSKKLKTVPKILRGDSHRLVQEKTYKAWAKKMLITALFKQFRAALSVGRANETYLKMHGFHNEDIFFAPHAVDRKRFFPDEVLAEKKRAELEITQDKIVCLFAGKFEKKKCPTDLVRCFLNHAPENFVLLMVGSGALEQEVRTLVGLDSRVRITGFANQSAMPDFYRAADVIILPSYGQGETWGFCVQEGMCCGNAVIVSSHVGCALDLVEEGGNGYVFSAGVWPALACILSQFPRSRDKVRQMGRKSLEIVSNYTYEVATEGLIRAIEHVRNG